MSNTMSKEPEIMKVTRQINVDYKLISSDIENSKSLILQVLKGNGKNKFFLIRDIEFSDNGDVNFSIELTDRAEMTKKEAKNAQRCFESFVLSSIEAAIAAAELKNEIPSK